MGIAKDISERFWTKAKIIDHDSCWLWQGQISGGYGKFKIKTKSWLAHRVSWMLFNKKDIPDGYLVRHRCDNRQCVNPYHLELGTHKDNVNDMILRKRNKPKRGTSQPNSKLTPKDVLEIKDRDKTGHLTHIQLGVKYGVSPAAIGLIRMGRNWRDLTEDNVQSYEQCHPLGRNPTVVQRFWARVEKKEENECWNWTNPFYSAYPNIKIASKAILAHRFSWEIHNKQSIPKDRIIMHTCDNHKCMNPNHLRLGTKQENATDMVKKGRWRGCKRQSEP